jgi:hypothetical protein
MKVDLLLAKRQGLSAVAKVDNLHSHDLCIELTGLIEVGVGQDQVIKSVDLHDRDSARLALIELELAMFIGEGPLCRIRGKWQRPGEQASCSADRCVIPLQI